MIFATYDLLLVLMTANPWLYWMRERTSAAKPIFGTFCWWPRNAFTRSCCSGDKSSMVDCPAFTSCCGALWKRGLSRVCRPRVVTDGLTQASALFHCSATARATKLNRIETILKRLIWYSKILNVYSWSQPILTLFSKYVKINLFFRKRQDLRAECLVGAFFTMIHLFLDFSFSARTHASKQDGRSEHSRVWFIYIINM